MKICKLRLINHNQFKDIELDFTDKNGEPLNKICLIGINGTGKSTILNILKSDISNFPVLSFTDVGYLKLKINNKFYYVLRNASHLEISADLIVFDSSVDENQNWFDRLVSEKFLNLKIFDKYLISRPDYYKLLRTDYISSVIYSPAEAIQNEYLNVHDFPLSDLNDALKIKTEFPVYNVISNETIKDFWNILMFNIALREENRQDYENKDENINKTKKQLIEEFDKIHPKILEKLSVIWNKILEKAGLEFDYKNAKIPYQLTDNLQANLKIKNTGNIIHYNLLSTGIRNFIFKIGHIYSIYFNREIKNGFLFVDEPENSLYPEFLYDLIDIYKEITTDKNNLNNTQMFFATHNPIIAGQFDKEERIKLYFDENGYVKSQKGFSPAGIDPNNLLLNDFEIKNTLGKDGIEKWNYYIELKKKLRKTKDESEKNKIVEEILKIGKEYNFE